MEIKNNNPDKWYIKIDHKTHKAKLVLSKPPETVLTEAPTEILIKEVSISIWEKVWNWIISWVKK